MHMAQLMPLPLTVSCFSKIQIGFTFLVPAHAGSLGKKGRCVCILKDLFIKENWYLFRPHGVDTAGGVMVSACPSVRASGGVARSKYVGWTDMHAGPILRNFSGSSLPLPLRVGPLESSYGVCPLGTHWFIVSLI